MNFVDIAAKGFAGAVNTYLIPVFIVVLCIAAMGAMTATVLDVLVSARRPSRSHLRAAATGALLCIVSSLVIWAAALPVPRLFGITLSALANAMPYVAALVTAATLAFHIQHRATFSTQRTVAIASAIAVPVIFFAVLSVL